MTIDTGEGAPIRPGAPDRPTAEQFGPARWTTGLPVVVTEVPVVRSTDFADWYADTAEAVTGRVCAAVADPLLGREATAEAYARAYRRWSRVSAMKSPEGWVYRVAMNVCRRSRQQRALENRALARLVPELLGGRTTLFEDSAEHPAYHPDDLYRAVRRLPDRMRLALRLKYWDDLTEREIAERMGVQPGTASSTLSLARDRLRRVLKAPDDPDTPAATHVGGGR